MPKNLDEQSLADVMMSNGRPFAVVFTAIWCPYCKRLAPIIEEIANEQKDTLDIYNIDIDDHPDIADRYDVMTIPTVYMIKDGEVVGNVVNPGTKEAVLALITT